MKNKQYYILGGVILIVIVGLLFWFGRNDANRNQNNNTSGPAGDPLDVVLDFYNPWLSVTKEAGPQNADSALLNSASLSQPAAAALKTALTNKGDGGADPVLCQTVTPDRVGAKVVHNLPTESEIMVFSRYRDDAVTAQGYALVNLALENNAWKITSITCAAGDVLPASEFTFEQSGHLLKSVPAPLNSEYWHLVFVEDNTPGHAAELHFTTESKCVIGDEAEAVCDPAKLQEASEASIQGNMTETGVTVVKLVMKK